MPKSWPIPPTKIDSASTHQALEGKNRNDPYLYMRFWSYDQNKFQLFLLIKTIEKIAIFEKSFLGPIKEFLIFFFEKCENTP